MVVPLGFMFWAGEALRFPYTVFWTFLAFVAAVQIRELEAISGQKIYDRNSLRSVPGFKDLHDRFQELACRYNHYRGKANWPLGFL